mgnify:CR=1 FL=1
MEHNISKENFVQCFIENFVPTISIKQLKRLNCYAPNFGYLWMVCEHNLVKNFKGLDAMSAYDSIDKTGAVEFQYDNGFMGDDVSVPLSTENDSSIKIKNNGLIEFYVIGKNFSWCYIVTHERGECGPYFIINKKIYNKMGRVYLWVDSPFLFVLHSKRSFFIIWPFCVLSN